MLELLTEKQREALKANPWLVEWDGRFFSFSPQTQLQKDIWLGTEGASTEMLRWLCFTCGELQMP